MRRNSAVCHSSTVSGICIMRKRRRYISQISRCIGVKEITKHGSKLSGTPGINFTAWETALQDLVHAVSLQLYTYIWNEYTAYLFTKQETACVVIFLITEGKFWQHDHHLTFSFIFDGLRSNKLVQNLTVFPWLIFLKDQENKISPFCIATHSVGKDWSKQFSDMIWHSKTNLVWIVLVDLAQGWHRLDIKK